MNPTYITDILTRMCWKLNSISIKNEKKSYFEYDGSLIDVALTSIHTFIGIMRFKRNTYSELVTCKR